MKYRVRSVQDSLDGESYLEYTEKLQLNQIQQRLLAPKKKLTKSELKSKIEELFTERQKIEKKLKKATKNSKPSKKELKLNKMKLIIESQKIERELKKRR